MTDDIEKNSFSDKIHRVFRHNGLLLLWLTIAAVALLGAAGYILYLGPKLLLDPLRIIYLTLQLFTLESNIDINEGVTWPLTLARILAPALLAFAAWETFVLLFSDQIRHLRIPFLRNHIIICGLGERGYYLAKSLLKKAGKKPDVIIIEPDQENDRIATCKQLGATVLSGNSCEEAILHDARIEHAKTVYAMTGDDGTNLNIALLSKKIIGRCNVHRTAPLRCMIAMTNVLFAESAHDRNIICSDSCFEFTILRFNEIRARLLFEKHPLDADGIDSQSSDHVHLVVVGFGSLGESIALQAARIGHFANGKQITITFVDKNATGKLKLLLQMFPGLSKCASWCCENLDIQSSSFIDRMLVIANEPSTILHFAICLNNSTLALHVALRIKRALHDRAIKIYVRMENNAHDIPFLKVDDQCNCKPAIYHFGMLSEICSAEMIDNKLQDHLARKLHESYVRERKAEGKSDVSTVPWEILDHNLRDSNRQRADHLPIKLRAIGCFIKPVDEQCNMQRVTSFTPEEVEILARMENIRCKTEQFAADCESDKENTSGKLFSPYLIGNDKLDNSFQEYDRQAIRNIPALLECENMWIYRPFQE
jgi:voltage-gated potassium channel Kch